MFCLDGGHGCFVWLIGGGLGFVVAVGGFCLSIGSVSVVVVHWVVGSGWLREIEEERLIREKRERVNFYIILLCSFFCFVF